MKKRRPTYFATQRSVNVRIARIGESNAPLALDMSDCGSLVECQRLFLLGMELDKRRLDRINRCLHRHHDLVDFSATCSRNGRFKNKPKETRWKLIMIAQLSRINGLLILAIAAAFSWGTNIAPDPHKG